MNLKLNCSAMDNIGFKFHNPTISNMTLFEPLASMK